MTGHPFLCRRILLPMKALLRTPSLQKILPRKMELPLMEKAKKRRIKKREIKNPKIREPIIQILKSRELKIREPEIKNQKTKNPKARGKEAKAKETRERETREKTAKGKPSKRIVKVGILPEKSRKKEKKRKTGSPQDRGKEKSGKPRKRGMISLRNGKILANGRSRKSNIPLKKNKKNRGVWPGFCVWNRRNIRIFEIFSGGCPWIGKRWK